MDERRTEDPLRWLQGIKGDPLPWLLEPENPSARYLTLRYVLGRPEEDAEVQAARAGILDAEPACAILAAQWPAGYWVAPGRGYTPRYRATVWQLLFLAQLGAPPAEPILRACAFVWEHSRREDGLFTPRDRPVLADLINLNGNLIWALAYFGFAEDPRMEQVLDALGRLDLTRLFEKGSVAPVVKLTRGLQAVASRLSPSLMEVYERAIAFLLDHLTEMEASPEAPLYFPLAEDTDPVEILTVWGKAQINAPQMQRLVEVVLSRQDAQGRWPLDRSPGKMWASFGEVGKPNKWVTWRAVRALLLGARDAGE